MKVRFHHRSPDVGSRPDQRGATVVEGAVAVGIFVVMLLSFIDIGIGVFETSQATSAAADGARAAIIEPDLSAADLEAAVRRRMPDRDISSIVLTCIEPDGDPVASDGSNPAGDCNNATVDPDNDKVRVKVRWRWQPIGPIGVALPDRYIEGTATLAIVPQPRTPTTPVPPVTP